MAFLCSPDPYTFFGTNNRALVLSGLWENAWEQFKLLKDTFGRYFVTIDKVANLNKLEYKFTRGNLISVESDEFGNELPIRLNEFGKTDTIYTKIDNWEDLADKKDNFITIVIDHVPENTPKIVLVLIN